MSLRPSLFTFTEHELRQEWRNFPTRVPLRRPHPPYQDGLYNFFVADIAGGPARIAKVKKFCKDLYTAASDSGGHIARLESTFEKLYQPASRPSWKYSEDAVVRIALSRLCQLPAVPPDISSALHSPIFYPSGYMIEGQTVHHSRSSVTGNERWASLLVVNHVNVHVLRMALAIGMYDLGCSPGLGGKNAKVLTATLELLKESLSMLRALEVPDPKWAIVCAFLWTSWHRMAMILLWEYTRVQFKGFDYESSELSRLTALRTMVPEVFEVLAEQQSSELNETPYLCGWAFRILQNSQSNILMDVRYFFEVYRSYSGRRLPVCNQDSTQCDGSSPFKCQRFTHSLVENQSSHDQSCQGHCPKLFWCRDSFISTTGARAVDIVTTDTTTLRYCPATEKTLAVSHVWSHGQGGRPDHAPPEGTGFNSCLHRRYKKIAESLGYQSYWMDTPCIPSEKTLKKECIAQINSIFATSDKTLICDRDIMDIDVLSPNLQTYESILAILLVCDWNMRAWTLLESAQGRSGLCVLCRDSKVLDVREVANIVHQEGRMDLVNLLCDRGYILPPLAIADDYELFGKEGGTEQMWHMQNGFMSIGEAAVHLSHRHATRDADDVIIWSLLIGDLEFEDSIQMWKRRVGEEIQTGLLVSSAPRIEGHTGLGWAPYRPAASRAAATTMKSYPAYDGTATLNSRITDRGLLGFWLVYEFPVLAFEREHTNDTRKRGLPSQIVAIVDQYLRPYNHGILLQVCPCRGIRSVPVPYPETYGPLLVVCGSDDGEQWEWQGVHEWKIDERLPEFSLKKILLV